jgi:hypothetical protein
MNTRAYLAFLSRLAILCNICYLVTMAIMYIPGWPMPNFLANFFAVLGLEMAPFINIIVVSLLVFAKFKKNQITVPRWQTIINVGLLLVQLVFLFA